MAPPSPRQIAARERVEQLLRVVAPVLDLVLLVGDRVSRAVDRSDDEPLPAIRYPTEARPLQRPATR
ncbi:MAG TPA: hypothetical protein VFR97_00480 [Capillimicrobium sp.]|nr:hypothetical protein [Capillimicrobium sp.]